MQEQDKLLLITADYNYLSARLLFMHGLFLVSYYIAAMAIEHYIKCLEFLKKQKFKKGHNIENRITSLGIKLDSDIINFIRKLERSYKEKYPDQWQQGIKWENELKILDKTVVILRNFVISEFKKLKPKNKDDLLKACLNNRNLLPSVTLQYDGMDTITIFTNYNESLPNFEYLV